MNTLTTATKFDDGKARIELVPPESVLAAAKVFTFGAQKYGDHNWEIEPGMDWQRLFGACMRHLWAWIGKSKYSNENFAFGPLDTETKMSHLWHALCCLMMLVAYESRGMGGLKKPRRRK